MLYDEILIGLSLNSKNLNICFFIILALHSIERLDNDETCAVTINMHASSQINIHINHKTGLYYDRRHFRYTKIVSLDGATKGNNDRS